MPEYAGQRLQWGYEELKNALADIGFEIVQEVGLVMGGRDMDAFYAAQPREISEFYEAMKAYIPKTWLTAIMSVPFPEASKEILFVVRKTGDSA